MKSIIKRQILIDIVVVLVSILSVCFFQFFPRRHLSKNHRYTVATIIEIEAISDGDNAANIIYSINDSVFKGTMSSCCKSDNSFYKKGERLFIMYYPIDPNESEVIFDTPVPDTLTHIPKIGWENLPI